MNALRPVQVPRLALAPSDVDVAIVGAGAAGIAAARRCLAEGLTCTVLEARNRIGGRCVTVPVGGRPLDLGAHWLHAGDLNPLVALGRERGEPLVPAPRSGGLVVEGVLADEATARAQFDAFETAGAAIAEAAGLSEDPSIADVLPELGRWRQPVAATLALISGRPLDEVSAHDFPSEEFGDNWFAKGGYGAYLARLAEGLPIALGHPVDRIDWSGEGVSLEGPGGQVRARAAIVTVPIALLAEDRIRFAPALPEPARDAIAAFLPGTYEHVVLDWANSPFREADRLVKIVGPDSSYGLMTRIEGGPLHYFEIDHATAEVLGRDASSLAAFTRDWLAARLGRDAVRGLAIPCVTDWVRDSWSRAAWAVARPGRAPDRRTLAEPIGERLWIAGEATSVRLWGTVGGAWEEGDAAALAAARRLKTSPADLPDLM